MDLILSSDFPLKDNEDVIEFIKNKLIIQTIKTAFISALRQGDQFEKYKNNFIEYGLHMIEYFEITKEIDFKEFEYLHKFDILYLHGGDPFNTNNLQVLCVSCLSPPY